jgi:hypothetical protein
LGASSFRVASVARLLFRSWEDEELDGAVEGLLLLVFDTDDRISRFWSLSTAAVWSSSCEDRVGILGEMSSIFFPCFLYCSRSCHAAN